MFSGIIESKAKILSVENGVFRVTNTFSEPLHVGQSIAHDGACMTLTSVSGEYYEFFSMQESLNITNFGTKKTGDFFNVERCVKVGERIDGHIVSGHIDTVGKVIHKELLKDGSLILGVSHEKEFAHLVIKKGSITLNGVSLTLVSIENDVLTVSLIPITQDWTNLGQLSLGDVVNIEYDMLGKYIARFQENVLQQNK